MERELLEVFATVKKAADAAAVDGISSSGPEVSRCLDAFKGLKGFPITKDVLVSTQVGKQLRHLTKHPKERIRNVASDVLEVWKKIVIEESSQGKKNGTIDDKISRKSEVKIEKTDHSGASRIEKTKSSETVKVEKVYKDGSTKYSGASRVETVKVERKDAHSDTVMAEKSYQAEPAKTLKIKKEERVSSVKSSQPSNTPPKLTSLIKCNDQIRDKMRELLVEAFSKVAGEASDDIKEEVDACDPIRVAVSVESAMFEKMGRSNGAQKVKYRSILFNLKDAKNPDFRRKVLMGQIKPEMIVNLKPEEMASDERQRENQQIKEKALFDCERGGAPKATTDQFKCGRCGQRKCTYYQMQTRSADEPMTTYVTCVNCNNRWKFC